MRAILIAAAVYLCFGCSTQKDTEQVTYTEVISFSSKIGDSLNYNPLPKSIQPRQLYTTSLKSYHITSDHQISFEDSHNLMQRQYGNVVECEGYQSKCLIISDYFKFMLPEDFSFNVAEEWSWQDFDYQTLTKRDLTVLGESLELIEIWGSSTENDVNVTFFVNEQRGLVFFSLEMSHSLFEFYSLSDRSGFWAN